MKLSLFIQGQHGALIFPVGKRFAFVVFRANPSLNFTTRAAATHAARRELHRRNTAEETR